MSNAPTAQTSIERWALAIEERGHRIELSHSSPSKWNGGHTAARLPGISRDQHDVYQWECPTDGPLRPGHFESDFEIVSDLAPGFVLAAFYGKAQGNELSREDWDSLPAAAVAQLKQALGTAFDSKTDYVIGPQFAPGTAFDGIEANFLFGLRYLKTQHKIAANSMLAESIEAELDRSLLQPARPFLRSRLDFMAKDASPTEAEAVNALGLALQTGAVK